MAPLAARCPSPSTDLDSQGLAESWSPAGGHIAVALSPVRIHRSAPWQSARTPVRLPSIGGWGSAPPGETEALWLLVLLSRKGSSSRGFARLPPPALCGSVSPGSTLLGFSCGTFSLLSPYFLSVTWCSDAAPGPLLSKPMPTARTGRCCCCRCVADPVLNSRPQRSSCLDQWWP